MIHQRGGLQKPTQLCFSSRMNAYLNSILNSHEISKWAIHNEPNLLSNNTWDGKFSIFYEKFLHDYVYLYYTRVSSTNRNDLRISMKYLNNAKSYERELHHRTLNKILNGMPICDVYRFITQRINEYKVAVLKNDDLKSSGSDATIIQEILESNPTVKYVKNKFINDMRISSDITDIFIYYEYEGEINTNSVNLINKIYDTALLNYDGFICSDIVLDQVQVQKSEAEHSMFYNMMECVAQNDDNIYFVPLDLLAPKIQKKNIYGLLEHVIRNDMTVNECFYFPDEVFGYIIPSVLHYQRINYKYGTTTETHSLTPVMENRLKDYKQLLLSQNDDPLLQPKYVRHASSLSIMPEKFYHVNDIITALKKYKRNYDEDELLKATSK